MDRAECRSPARADSHLDAAPSPGLKPEAKLRDQLRRCSPTSAPLRPVQEELRPNISLHPSLSLLPFKISTWLPAGDRRRKREEKKKRKRGRGGRGETRVKETVPWPVVWQQAKV